MIISICFIFFVAEKLKPRESAVLFFDKDFRVSPIAEFLLSLHLSINNVSL